MVIETSSQLGVRLGSRRAIGTVTRSDARRRDPPLRADHRWRIMSRANGSMIDRSVVMR